MSKDNLKFGIAPSERRFETIVIFDVPTEHERIAIANEALKIEIERKKSLNFNSKMPSIN